jgi:trk system potassium uptake protein TrkH
MHFDSVTIDLIITVFMALSAMHFGIIFAVMARRSLKPLKHPVTKYYYGVIAICSVIIAFSLKTQGGYGSWGAAALDATFQTVSYLSTTGFGQADNAHWPLLANTILLFTAIHCGCSGSTTGGIKADRMLIAFKAIKKDFLKRLHPSSLFRTKVGSKVINDSTVTSVFLYIVLYLVIIFFSFIIVLICGVEIGDAFSGTISSLGNVGPGIGTIGTMGNYSGLSSIVKFIFTIDMFIGRLEIFPILIIMSMIFKRQK